MTFNLKIFLILALMWTAGDGVAGSLLSLRLVEASHAGQGMGVGLGDVANLLQNNLPYKSFQLLASRSMALPANGVASLSSGLVARCSGGQDNLSVVLERGGKKIMQTTVELRDGTPLIIGGISSAQGKLIIVLLTK
jgi:hypothetical protein